MSLAIDPRRGTTADEVLRNFVGWLNRRFAKRDAPISAGTRLFADGRIDSIGILHLIAWVERASGRKIPDRLVRIDYFETPAMIVERFFGSTEDALR
jgi:acyl carrier protein